MAITFFADFNCAKLSEANFSRTSINGGAIANAKLIGITIHNTLTLAAGSSLELLFSGATWGSTISVALDVSPLLAGTLDLEFADEMDFHALLGTKFHVFDGYGTLAPGSHFDRITSLPGFARDASSLYTLGDLTLRAVPEPPTLALAILGGLCLTCACRRRMMP